MGQFYHNTILSHRHKCYHNTLLSLSHTSVITTHSSLTDTSVITTHFSLSHTSVITTHSSLTHTSIIATHFYHVYLKHLRNYMSCLILCSNLSVAECSPEMSKVNPNVSWKSVLPSTCYQLLVSTSVCVAGATAT